MQLLDTDPSRDAATEADDVCIHLLHMLGVPPEVARKYAYAALPAHDFTP